MLVSLFRKLLRDRRAATAVVMAILLVPMLISAGVAVDMARIASVRSLLQASADSAANAGVDEWQLSESSTDAYNVAKNAFANTGAQLPNFAGTVTPTIELVCLGTTTQCGQSYAYANSVSYGCPALEYCIVVTATITLRNSLLAPFIPSDLLSVTAGAAVAGPGKNQPAEPGHGTLSAGDYNLFLVAPVGTDGDGATDDNTVAEENTFCSGLPSIAGQQPTTTPGEGVTTCNYLFISDSLQQTSSLSTTISEDELLTFLFLNKTGADGYNQIDGTHYTTHLMISTTSSSNGYQYFPGGETVTSPPVTCHFNQSGCTPSLGGTTKLYGQCPDHTLYGSIDSNYGAPSSDSLNEYSSANEVLGDPPTFATNHVLTPFVTTNVVTQTIGSTTYYVEAVCPNLSTAGTKINAPVSTAYSNILGNQDFAGMNTFATWFPTGVLSPPGLPYISGSQTLYDPNNTAFVDNSATPAQGTYTSTGTPIANTTSGTITNGTNDIYPPALAGCAPPTSVTDNAVTPASADPWWNWSGSNYGNCTSHQSSSYSNCALLIQPLGTDAPADSNGSALLPDYYNIIETPSGTVLELDPVYDNMTYTDVVTGVTITNTDQAGYFPPNTIPTSTVIGNTTTIHGGGSAMPFANTAFVGDLLVVEAPASNGSTQDHNPPQMTSNRCYNPGAATQDGGYRPVGSATDLLGYYEYTNNGVSLLLPIDPIANPQLGAFVCNTDPPETYAAYWNDLGTYESDDLGYWNSIGAFTCSTPGTSNAGAGGSSLFE